MFALVLIASLAITANAVDFVIRNNELGPIWIGIQGNDGREALRGGGFNLDAESETTVSAPNDWAGRFWARTWCDSGSQHCETGDCGNKLECQGAGGVPPVSLAEITLNGYGGIDYYDISLVDGFNLYVKMGPLDGSGDGGQYSCKMAQCTYDINNECPGELQLVGSSGYVIGCKSACLAFNTDEYCCRGAHDRPETCLSSDWPHDYPSFFKQRCPDAYSYAYDDHKSTFTCAASRYRIEFGGYHA